MIDIGGTLINPRLVTHAEVAQRLYMNGSAAHLTVVLTTGERIVREHGWGFDAFAALEKIKEAVG